ncbi:MAG: hypothetical protein LC099_05905 [Anaerolineales bacterium]|nr:hypothetical protein [Anaerolineales bacterium]
MKFRVQYIPFLALAILGLMMALWAGLLRIGWQLPPLNNNLAVAHGPLMICGFLGVLIPLERAVAIRRKWMFLAPLFSGLGWILILIYPFAGKVLMTLGSFGMLGILLVMVRREPHIHTITMAVGSLAWVLGNVLWLSGQPLFRVVFWWMAFLVLTIGGERLELSRVLRPTRAQVRLFTVGVVALLAGAILALFNLDWGARLNGLAMLGLALWFLRNDIAARNIRHRSPLTRYLAYCLFGGFVWLGIGGALQLVIGGVNVGALYDAELHSVFIGFVMSMIFGHALIIFPAILNTPVQYRPEFYGHLVLLNLSLLIRVVGDLTNQFQIRRWGGMLNEVAILLFLAATIYSVIKSKK